MFNHLLIMGSSERRVLNPQLPMESEKKSIKSILKKPFQALFQKDKKKEKKQVVVEQKQHVKPSKPTTVAVLLENFEKLEIDKKKKEEDDDDELKNFTVTIVEDKERTPIRTDSEDSGFSESAPEKVDLGDKTDLIESLKELKVEGEDDKKRKKEKLRTVVVSRGPVRGKVVDYGASAHPYNIGHPETTESNRRQISQINRQTFSGGQVTVVNDAVPDKFEINLIDSLNVIEKNVQNFVQKPDEQIDAWQVAQEFLNDQTSGDAEDILQEFWKQQEAQNLLSDFSHSVAEPSPIDKFSTTNHASYEQYTNLDLSISEFVEEENRNFIFPTPPRSDTMPSPMSDSTYRSVSEYPRSPSMSSPLYNSDNEKYQDLSPFEMVQDYPKCITDEIKKDIFDRSKRDRISTCSLTMKQYKDMQKELSVNFSKKECCQVNRKTCKQLFLEHMEKLKVEDRRTLCVKVAKLDEKTAYGVLHHILLSLSTSETNEDVDIALFGLICEMLLAQSPALFVSSYGLSLIKSAALRCYRRPILTRYLVQCVRTALRTTQVPPGTNHVFHEVDSLGDNLLIACVRAGDACADVLSELVRADGGDVPLFDVNHANTDGYTALQVCCSLHCAESPRLHTLHVLLQHANADVWRGDVKGGDTALHLAINSPTCDLRVVMIIFRHIDRKEWKKLAYTKNRSSVTPLEYARSASKCTTRQNYPHEVLEFLKKCR